MGFESPFYKQSELGLAHVGGNQSDAEDSYEDSYYEDSYNVSSGEQYGLRW